MLSRSLVVVAFAGVATAFSPSMLPGVMPAAQFRSVRPMSVKAGPLHVRATAAIPMQQTETPRLAPWRQNLDLAGWASEVSQTFPVVSNAACPLALLCFPRSAQSKKSFVLVKAKKT